MKEKIPNSLIQEREKRCDSLFIFNSVIEEEVGERDRRKKRCQKIE